MHVRCLKSEPRKGAEVPKRGPSRSLAILLAVAVIVLTTAEACQEDKAPQSDDTPPRIVILKYDRASGGQQGPQVTVQPGGEFTLSDSWLGWDKANIRVEFSDNEGVRWLKLAGSARAKCSTKPNASGVVYTDPGFRNVSFPTHEETTASGTVKKNILRLVDQRIKDVSCGTRRLANMPQSAEFFAYAATWTIATEAENCCGGRTSAQFKIVVTE